MGTFAATNLERHLYRVAEPESPNKPWKISDRMDSTEHELPT